MERSIRVEPIFGTKQIGVKEVPIYIVNGEEYTDVAKAEAAERQLLLVEELQDKLSTIKSFTFDDEHTETFYHIDSVEKMCALWQHLGLYSAYDNVHLHSTYSNIDMLRTRHTELRITPEDLYTKVGNTCWLYTYQDGGDYASTHTLADARDGLTLLRKFLDNLRECGLSI